MAITLNEAKVGVRDKLVAGVYDLFARNSVLMDRLTFDDVVSPTGGSSLVYGYQVTKVPGAAGLRAVNEEYTAQEAKREEKTATCSILGGSYQIDRVLAKDVSVNEIQYQTEEKVKTTAAEFSNLVINGNHAHDSKAFDGLNVLLAGSDSEFVSSIDVSTSAKLDENNQELLDELDALVAHVPGCNLILVNLATLLKIRSAARRAGVYERDVDGFGRPVEKYNGIEMLDVGKTIDANGNEVDIIPTAQDGTTAIYAVKLGLDGFHGISPKGDKIIDAHFPDLDAPGVLKLGDVEFVGGVALKTTKAAAVLTGLKIKAAA